MRFSIRGILAAMAYVALVTTAAGTGSDLLAGLIWAISILAVAFAIVVACIARQRRQALALGFVVMAVANMAALCIVPHQLPVQRIAYAAGYVVDGSGTVYQRVEVGGNARLQALRGMGSAVRTANAVGTSAAGLVGCLVSWLAYWYVHETDDGRR